MKNTNKILSLLLACICLISLITGCKTTEKTNSETSNVPPKETNIYSRIGEEDLQYPGENEEYLYNVYETYIEIKKYLGDAADISIPATIEDLPVKVVGGFHSNKTIKNVVLPEGIVVIDNIAFDRCINLQTINIPASVVEIGRKAFFACTELKSLTIPKSVTTIGEHAFGVGSEHGGYSPITTLVVRFYKGSAAAEYVAKHSSLQYEIIDK